MLGLQCCMGSSLVAKSTDYFPVMVLELLIKVASPVVEHGLQGSWVSAVVSAWAQKLQLWSSRAQGQ